MTVTTLMLVMALSQPTTTLSNTEWAEVSDSGDSARTECSIRFEFVGDRYRYKNDCTGQGRNKVVEFGSFERLPDSIVLTDRRVVVGTGSIFGESAEPVTIKLDWAESSEIIWQFAESVLTLKYVGVAEW
jgi:hypothetical protein